MKRALTAGVLSLTIATAASAATTAQVYQGDMFFTNVPGCAAAGDDIGDFTQAVFSPYSTNRAADALTLLGARGSAMQITPSTGTALGGSTVTSFKLTVINHNAGGNQQTVKAGPFTVSYSQTNGTVTISGTMANFEEIKGCTVTMSGTLYPVPTAAAQ